MQHHNKRKVSLIILLLAMSLIPAQAQEAPFKRVVFDDLGFVLNPAFATNVNAVQLPGDPVSEIYPGGPQPPHTQFLLYSDLPAPEFLLQSRATITVYPLGEMEGYTGHEQNVEKLRELLATHPDLNQFEQTRDSLSEITLPFLPPMMGAQVIRARTEYIENEAIHGLAYVTVYRQDVAPFLDYEFIYTFQGLSTDDGAYVSVVMPIKATMFPDVLPSEYNFEDFVAAMNSYFAESIDLLNAGQPNDFVPALTTGIGLVESISFGR